MTENDKRSHPGIWRERNRLVNSSRKHGKICRPMADLAGFSEEEWRGKSRNVLKVIK